jgi:hypothetical protein
MKSAPIVLTLLALTSYAFADDPAEVRGKLIRELLAVIDTKR